MHNTVPKDSQKQQSYAVGTTFVTIALGALYLRNSMLLVMMCQPD